MLCPLRCGLRCPAAAKDSDLCFLEAIGLCQTPRLAARTAARRMWIEDGVDWLARAAWRCQRFFRARSNRFCLIPPAPMKWGRGGRERVQADYTFERFQTGLSRALEDVLIRQH